MTDIIDELKIETSYQLEQFAGILPTIETLYTEITNASGNIYAFGIGKSGNMAKHFIDLLKSVSIPAFYCDSTDLLHGNIGTVKKNDMVILFSQSGNTKELLDLIPYFKQREACLWGVTNNFPSSFDQFSPRVVHLPLNQEIRQDSIPTNSCLSQLLFSNILVTFLKGAVTLPAYRANHPAGDIGKKLKKIKEVMCTEYPVITLNLNDGGDVSLTDVLLEMTRWKMGCCFFIKPNGELLGLLTDGDIRRLILKCNNKNTITLNDINTTFYAETDTEKLLKACKNCHFIPVTTPKGILRGIVFNAKQKLN